MHGHIHMMCFKVAPEHRQRVRISLTICSPKKPYMKNYVGRMWSGGAREHYASQSSDRKLKSLPTLKQDQRLYN